MLRDRHNMAESVLEAFRCSYLDECLFLAINEIPEALWWPQAARLSHPILIPSDGLTAL